ncbi:MAG: hypothetical protein WCN88_00090 [Candidatus Falkowbacteria bacterium]
MGKLFKVLYFVLAIIFFISWFEVKKLPAASEINPALLQAPIQASSTERVNFDYYYRNKWYSVKPLADYELWGLVVSQNNINAWYNYYHDENSVNLKDVCVVWGDNVKDGAYNQKSLNFKSGEWTCYFGWSGNLEKQFYPFKLSNNHLLADNEKVLSTIRNVNIGDQIHFKGALIDYSEKGSSWLRQTSLSREDENGNSRSGGACEIVFVDKIDIIKHNKAIWNSVYDWTGRVALGTFLLNILWVFIDTRRRPHKS